MPYHTLYHTTPYTTPHPTPHRTVPYHTLYYTTPYTMPCHIPHHTLYYDIPYTLPTLCHTISYTTPYPILRHTIPYTIPHPIPYHAIPHLTLYHPIPYTIPYLIPHRTLYHIPSTLCCTIPYTTHHTCTTPIPHHTLYDHHAYHIFNTIPCSISCCKPPFTPQDCPLLLIPLCVMDPGPSGSRSRGACPRLGDFVKEGGHVWRFVSQSSASRHPERSRSDYSTGSCK